MICACRKEDIPFVMSLWLESAVRAHSFIPEKYWHDNFEKVEQQILPASQTFVFRDRHRVKGFISLLNGTHIGALFVAPDYQGRRIGSKLLNYVKQRHPCLSLNVYAQNRRALAFYQAAGFKIIQCGRDEATGCDELLMSWALGCVSGFNKRYRGDS